MKFPNLTPEILLKEYLEYNVKSPLRFGQMIWNKYAYQGYSDTDIYYERNNGTAYALILAEITKNKS